MKTTKLQKMAAVMTVASLVWSASTTLAQDASVANVAPPAAASTPVPPLPYGVSQILQLAQAKVGDTTIIAYVKNSGNSYGLNADQIIYLRQQGISDGVITTMLSQPRPGVAVSTPTSPAPIPMDSTDYSGQVPTATAPPPVTYVQTVPDTTYYYQPYYYQPYYYYPGYVWYPPMSFSFGWRGGGYRGGHGGGFGGGGHSGVGHGGVHR